MKNLLLIISILFSTSFFVQGQDIPPRLTKDSTNNFLNEHYEGGAKAFLESVYKEINYPSDARMNCNSGILIAELTFGKNRQISNLNLYNPLGDGLEKEVQRILNFTKGGWKSSAEGKSVIISFAFVMGTREKLDGYINIIAGGPNYDNCGITKEFQKKLNKAIKKEKYDKALAYCIEIIRRNPWSEEHIKLYKELIEKVSN